MLKKFFWGLIALVPIAVILFSALHKQQHKQEQGLPAGVHRYRNGLITDLTRTEVEDAIKVLQQERAMWSHFNALTGGIQIDYAVTNKGTISLSGNISLKQLSSAPGVQPGLSFVMVIANEVEGWSITTDGTRPNTQIKCDAGNRVAEIRRIPSDAILQLLCVPKLYLVPLFKDEIFPQGREEMKQIIGSWNPWRNPDALNIPHSYTFKDSQSRMDALSFTDGHFSRWQRIRDVQKRGKASLCCRNPVLSNGVSFPTEFKFDGEGQRLTLTLSNVVVSNQ